METFFDSHIDLFQRTLQKQLQKHSDRLKLKAEEALKLRELSGDALVENMEREVKNFKLKVRNIQWLAKVLRWLISFHRFRRA